MANFPYLFNYTRGGRGNIGNFGQRISGQRAGTPTACANPGAKFISRTLPAHGTQNLDAQIDALKQAGCAKTFTDKESGVKSSRSGWDELLAYIRPGDTLVITELSRMSRSLMHLLKIVKVLEDRKGAFPFSRSTG